VPTVVRLSRCVLYIYANDHNPPHFHVRTSDGDAAIVIETLAVADGTIDRLALKEALQWARDNKDTLFETWNDLNA